jgi:predicted RNA-binding Zn-ribbon protein involved in translation (DUF1610 family)
MSLGDVALTDFSEHLFSVSRDAAQFAISNYSSEDSEARLLSALRAGMAVEVLVLAGLCAHAPALIADISSFPSHLYLSGVSRHSTLTVGSLKTIKVEAAIARLRVIHPALPYSPKAFKELMEVRNAAVHTGLVDRSALNGAAVTMVTMVEDLLRALGKSSPSYWRIEQLELVTHTLDLRRDALTKAVESKVVGARGKLGEFEKQIDGNLELALANLESRPSRLPGGQNNVRAACPACGRSAYLLYWVQDANLESTMADAQSGMPVIQIETVGIPHTLDCPVCGLALDSDELSVYPDLNEHVKLAPRVLSVEDYIAELSVWNEIFTGREEEDESDNTEAAKFPMCPTDHTTMVASQRAGIPVWQCPECGLTQAVQ